MHNLNLKPLMERMTIQRKDLSVDYWKHTEPFAWAQNQLLAEIERQYNLGLPVRIIVLKGRQVGISTISEGILFNWCFIHPGSRSLVMAHSTDSSKNIFEMTKMMWDTWPFHDLFHEKHASQKLLSWEETRSYMAVATARGKDVGRSFTFHALHGSEVAFWDDPERLMNGLSKSIPYKHGTIIILESTANGVGNFFHKEWNRAVRRESAYVPLFFPWFKHDEYEIKNTTLTYEDLSLAEREILEDFKTQGMSVPKLAWRRFTLKNECYNDDNQFKQEYPLTPQEAFLSTGRNVFPLQHLERCYDKKNGMKGMLNNNNGKLEFIKDSSGPLTIFRTPSRTRVKGKYVVAGDPTHTVYGDLACIQVFNRFTFEQVAVWHGHIDPVPFAQKLVELGFYYNTALINCEMEGPGYATIGAIMQLNYPNVWRYRRADQIPGRVQRNTYGWSTNYQRKHWAISQVIWLLGENRIRIHDEITYNQMSEYVVLNGGEMGPAENTGYDDAVMALAIGIASTITEPQLPHEEIDRSIQNDLFGKPPWEATPMQVQRGPLHVVV